MPAYHARIAFEGSNTASKALITNVLHVEVDTLTSPPNWTSIAADIDTWLGTLWRNILTVGDTFQQLVVTDENYPGSTHGQGVFPVQLAGTRAAADHKLDPAVCLIGSFKTGVAKRYARGHMFFAPAYSVVETADPAGFAPSGAYALAANAFLTAYKNGFVAGSTSYIAEVFSKHQVDLGATPFTFKILTAGLAPGQHFLRSRSTSP